MTEVRNELAHHAGMCIRMIPLLVAVQLCACAPRVWNKEGATQEDFTTDSYACERDVRQSGYYGGGLVGMANAKGFFNRCMEARGYHLDDANDATAQSAQSAADDRIAAAERCEAKGFRPPSKDYGNCFAAEFPGGQ